LEQSQKIGINSAYGLLGTQVLFNSPDNAELVTKYGREILLKSIKWATGKDYA
jgi:DNA polymerase elongation subunit (family B)